MASKDTEAKARDEKPAKAKTVPRATMTIKSGEKVYTEGDDVSALGEAEVARLSESGAVRVE